MNLNKAIPQVGAKIVSICVCLFAACLIVDFSFGAYLVCLALPIGYIMLAAGLRHECSQDRRVSADVGMAFAAIYAGLIFIVYFAQLTTVRHGSLNEQARLILDFKRGGLLFNYDLLGYGMMALSTLFIGLSIHAQSKVDRWMKKLMIFHGVFFVGCLIMPMTDVFAVMADGSTRIEGVIALVAWCIYFFPIGILAVKHFK